VRRRFFTLVDAAGLDEQRARAWVVVREMHNALWTIEDAVAERRALDADDRAGLTTAVTIAKAVQD
jgi:streptomycin 6-kinase